MAKKSPRTGDNSLEPSLQRLAKRISSFNSRSYKFRVLDSFRTCGEAESLRISLTSRSAKNGFMVSARIAILDAHIPQDFSRKIEVYLVGDKQRIQIFDKPKFIVPEQENMTVRLARTSNPWP